MPYVAAMYQCLLQNGPRLFLPLIGESFLFEDALGRRRNLPCGNFQQWKVYHNPRFLRLSIRLLKRLQIFYAHLISTFQNSPGLKNVVFRRFRIMNGHNSAIIDQQTWPTAIQPGVKVTMAMVPPRSTTVNGVCLSQDCKGRVFLSLAKPQGNW
jgi:hypothetical protein